MRERERVRDRARELMYVKDLSDTEKVGFFKITRWYREIER